MSDELRIKSLILVNRKSSSYEEYLWTILIALAFPFTVAILMTAIPITSATANL